MRRRTPLLAICGLMWVCTGGRAREAALPQHDGVVVEHNSARRETTYTASAGGCRVCWTVFEGEENRGVIRHRADCGPAPDEQAPLIAGLLRRVLAEKNPAVHFRTLSWGRLYPDGARDTTMALRLSLAAHDSRAWDAARGAPRSGDINGFVRKLANDALIYGELRDTFAQAGLDIRLASVEKVLLLEAGRLPYFESLRKRGVRAPDKLPFDFQAWFSVRPAGVTGR